MRRPRKIAIKLVPLLLLVSGGAIINVAVAWGCAAWSPLRYQIHQRDISPDECDWLIRVGCREIYQAGLYLQVMAELAGFGCDLVRFANVGNDGFDPLAAQIRTGWPCRTLLGGRRLATLVGGAPVDAIDLGRFRRVPQASTNRMLPLRPIWPGFAINTIFYAGVLWIVCAAPGTVKRIMRRMNGRCLHCGYDLRGQPADSKKCPECGNMVVVKCMGLPPPATPAQES